MSTQADGICERCWGKAFRAAYGIGSKTQTGEYERIVASCKCTPWQRLGVANGFAEGYEARLAEDAKEPSVVLRAVEIRRQQIRDLTEQGFGQEERAEAEELDKWLSAAKEIK